MKREQKFPDTMVFKFFNANQKNRIAGDCAVRAVSTALGISWETAVMEMTKEALKIGHVLNDKQGIEAYLKSQGWVKHSQPKKADGKKYTGGEFCMMLNAKCDYRPIVAFIGIHHIVCIKETDGFMKVNDIWDSTRKCIGNYWTKG